MSDEIKQLLRGWPVAFAGIFLLGLAWEGWRTGLVLALAMALPAAAAHTRLWIGAFAAAIALLMAGLVQPLIYSPQNLMLIPLGGLLALGSRVQGAKRFLVWGLLLGLVAAVPGPQRIWAPALAVGIGSSLWPLSLGERPLRLLAALLLLGGAARSIDGGFVSAQNASPRALWAEPIGPVAPGTSRSGWSWGRPVTWHLAEGGLSFTSPPAGPTMSRSDLSAVDRAELGLAADCPALLELALAGERRARVQHRLLCDASLAPHSASDPYVDAAAVVQGEEPVAPGALLSASPELPLDEPGAVLLHAQLSQGYMGPIGERFALGTSYEQALILHRLDRDERQALREQLEFASAQLPESLKGPWQRGQELIARLP